MDKIIKTGIGVMLLQDNKVLLGHRLSSIKDTGGIYEPNSWTFPGGKQKYEETIIETAIRETKEETNLDISNIHVYTATDEFQSDCHFVTIGVISSSYEGELIAMEPNKIDKWSWFDLDNLPDNIYTPTKNIIDEYIRRESSK